MPPLDKMRKVRREILRTINDIRSKFNNNSVFTDLQVNKAATEYAEYLLYNDDQENPEILKEIQDKHLILGEQKILQGIAYLEEDIVSKDPTKMDEYMDAHGLLLELQYELGQLTEKSFTHVGIGFACNTQKVKVVEMLSAKPLMLSNLSSTEDGSVEVRGTVLDKAVGLYAARIVAASNMKKEIAVVGPSAIEYNKTSGEFVVTLKPASLDDLFFSSNDPKYIELYISRRQVEKIKYGEAADASERIQVQHLELCLRGPMEYYPDPRTIIEDDVDRQRYERDMAERLKRQEEERLIMVAANLARKEERAKRREE